MTDRSSARHLSSLLSHSSRLVSTAAGFYLLHIVFHAKIAPLEITALLTIATLGWALARREARFSWHIIYYPLILYGIVSSVSALTSERRVHAAGEAMLWFKMLIFPAAVILFRELPRLRDLAVYAYATFAAAVSFWGLFEFIALDRRDLEHRITGPATHVMTFSGLLLPVSLLLLFLWLHQRRPWQIGIASLATLTLLLTFTRSVWIGWAVAVFTVLVFTRARIAFYALPVLIVFVTFLPLPLFSRLISTFDLQQSSNFDRIRMLEAGVEMIRDYPLLGVGPANVKETYSLYRRQDAPRPRPPHLHNNVVQLWAERGVLGVAAYVVLLALFLRECIREWKGPNRMWAEIGVAVTVSLAVAGLFEFNFGDTEVFYMLLNLMGLIAVSLERTQPVLNEVPQPLVAAST